MIVGCNQALDKAGGDAFVGCVVRLFEELEAADGYTHDELEEVTTRLRK